MIEIKVYAHTCTEAMLDAGKSAGLDDHAVGYFQHFLEVALVLLVDESTGAVLRIKSVNGSDVK